MQCQVAGVICTWGSRMLAENACRFAFVVTAGLAITACSRAGLKSNGGKDSGTTVSDAVAGRDLPAGLDVRPDAPEIGKDTGSDASDARPEAGDAARDASILDKDAGSDASDAPEVGDMAKDASIFGKESGTDTPGREARAVDGGLVACTGNPVLGRLLPLVEAGDFSTTIAVGDLNGDGKPDLVLGSAYYTKDVPSTVGVFLGTGGGLFGPRVDYVTGAGPASVALADVNGDHKLDIITANANDIDDNTVSVLVGMGDGTFGPKQDFLTGQRPESVALGDVNGDGKPDIVTGNWYDPTVSVLLGMGDGSFAAKRDFPIGNDLPSLAGLADVNGDHKLDIVVTDGVLLGAGDGTFAAKRDLPATAIPLAAGDISGESNLYLLTAVDGSSSMTTALMGTGGLAFGADPMSKMLGDLNRDGKMDLVVADPDSDTVQVSLGGDGGTFMAAVDYPGRYHPNAVALADVDGDGKLDLVVVNVYSNLVEVLLGTGDGRFDVGPNYPVGGHASSVALGDFDGDGRLDLAAASPDTNLVSVLRGVGDGTFTARQDWATGTGPAALALGDLNGDHRLDLVTANKGANTVSVLLGGAAGKMDYPTGSAPMSVAMGDLNGDGKPDLVTANYNDDSVSVLLGTGDGTFAAKTDYLTAAKTASSNRNALSVVLGDLNGDGQLDAVVGISGFSVYRTLVSVMVGSGDGHLAMGVDYQIGGRVDDTHLPDYGTQPLALADLDGDGRLDVVAANWSTNTLSVLLGTSAGVLGGAADYPTGPSPLSVVVADLNGDGTPDLATMNAAGTLSVLLGNGDGTFAPKVEVAAASAMPSGGGAPGKASLAAGDLDGDHRIDLVVASDVATTVSVVLNACH
jgi:hypothetical protein